MSISALTVYLIATRTFCTVHARKGYKTTLRLETCLNLKYTHFWHSNEIFIKSLPCTETSPGKLSSSRATTIAVLFVVLSSCALTFVKIRELSRAKNKLVGTRAALLWKKKKKKKNYNGDGKGGRRSKEQVFAGTTEHKGRKYIPCLARLSDRARADSRRSSDSLRFSYNGRPYAQQRPFIVDEKRGKTPAHQSHSRSTK